MTKATAERRALAARIRPASPADIREARRLLGLSQRGLAEALGVSHGSVSDWELGRFLPQAETLRRLVDLLEED